MATTALKLKNFVNRIRSYLLQLHGSAVRSTDSAGTIDALNALSKRRCSKSFGEKLFSKRGQLQPPQHPHLIYLYLSSGSQWPFRSCNGPFASSLPAGSSHAAASDWGAALVPRGRDHCAVLRRRAAAKDRPPARRLRHRFRGQGSATRA